MSRSSRADRPGGFGRRDRRRAGPRDRTYCLPAPQPEYLARQRSGGDRPHIGQRCRNDGRLTVLKAGNKRSRSRSRWWRDHAARRRRRVDTGRGGLFRAPGQGRRRRLRYQPPVRCRARRTLRQGGAIGQRSGARCRRLAGAQIDLHGLTIAQRSAIVDLSSHGARLAYRHIPGSGPMLVFLPGYMSDMPGPRPKRSPMGGGKRPGTAAARLFGLRRHRRRLSRRQHRALGGGRPRHHRPCSARWAACCWSARRWAAGSRCASGWRSTSGWRGLSASRRRRISRNGASTSRRRTRKRWRRRAGSAGRAITTPRAIAIRRR